LVLGGLPAKLARAVRYIVVAGGRFCIGSAGSSFVSLRLPAKTNATVCHRMPLPSLPQEVRVINEQL